MKENNNGFFKVGMQTLSGNKIIDFDARSEKDVAIMRATMRNYIDRPYNDPLIVKLYNFLKKNLEDGVIKKPGWVTKAEEETDYDNAIQAAVRDLWIFGFDDLKFIGRGGFGAILVDKKNNKAIKLTGLTGGVGTIGTEEKGVRKINEIFEKNKEAKKHIIDMKCINFRNIYEMPLAISDFEGIIKEKDEIRKKNAEIKQAGKKHIKNLLDQAESLLKAVVILHEYGYVHNDIKPGNLLKIKKDIKEFENEISNGRKKHKNKLVISDFGTITNINLEIERAKNMWDPYDNPEEAKSIAGFAFSDMAENYASYDDEESIKKRDVICCGYSLFVILCGEATSKLKPWNMLTRRIRAKESSEIYQFFNLKYLYESKDEGKIIQFVNVVKKMVAENVNERCSATEALEEIQKIRDS